MTPLRRGVAAGAAAGVSDPVRTPWRVIAYAVVLSALATGALVALVVSGAAWPRPLPLLVFTGLLALTITRAVLYPSEFAITTESALLLGAVVVFRDDAPVTGPLLLALLAGLLDRVHWEQRAFVRMAYNSGSRAIAILGAAAAFTATAAASGESIAASLLAVVTGAAVVTALDTLCAVGLDWCRGRRALRSWSDVLEIDALGLPLAVMGGAAGLLVVQVAWWAGIVPLVVLALAPEIAHARRVVSLVVLHDAVLAVELLAIAALAALWVSVPSLPTLLVLAAVAIVAGVELVVDGRVPIAPVLGVVVVGVTIAVGRDDAAFAAVLVAGLATAVSWWVSGRPLTARVLLSVLGATILGVAGALVATADVVGSVGDLAVGPAGLVLFALGAAVAARARFRAEAMAVVWVAPLAALASSRSVAGGHGQLAGLGLAVGTVGLAAMAGTWCGAAPWRSRFLSRRMGEVRGRGRRMTCGGLCVATAVLAVVSTVAEPHAAFVEGLAVTTGEIAVTMALFGVRQWRFAPGARARGVTLGVVLALALPLGVDDGRPGILLALGLAVTAMLIVVAGPVTGLADAAHDRGVSGD